jgi:predicted ATPase
MSQRKVDPSAQKVPIRHVNVKNFLSLQDVEVSLGKLNVLVGPNGGGKSNFLSVFRFLGEVARTDLAPALSRLFGGYDRVFCRAESAQVRLGVHISIKGEISEYSSPTALDEYSLRFRPAKLLNGQIGVRRDEVLLLKRSAGRGRRITLGGSKYEYETISPTRKGGASGQGATGEIGSDASALSVLRRIGARSDTEQVSQLAEVFEDLRLFDPNVDAARRPASVSDGIHLNPSASNLAAVLANLRDEQPDILTAIQDDIRYVLPGLKDLSSLVLVRTPILCKSVSANVDFAT